MTEVVDYFIPKYQKEIDEYKIFHTLVTGFLPNLSTLDIGAYILSEIEIQYIFQTKTRNKKVISPFTNNETTKSCIDLCGHIFLLDSKDIKYNGFQK